MAARPAPAVVIPSFRFDPETHEYYLDDVLIPHITGMLEATGYIDDEWFTEEACDRGTMVHRLAAEYDLGAISDPRQVVCEYKGWFLAHVEAMRTVHPTWLHVETALASPQHRFGGRPDRVGKVWGAWAVVDLKTGVPSKATPIQTALQAILVAPELHLPPAAIVRYELDVKENGKWRLFEHKAKSDFNEAYEVIRECTTA